MSNFPPKNIELLKESCFVNGIVLFICLMMTTSLSGQDLYLHSHNDYEQKMPLNEAIDSNFNSIEIDIVAYKEKLKVSHDTKRLKR